MTGTSVFRGEGFHLKTRMSASVPGKGRQRIAGIATAVRVNSRYHASNNS
jgi:hypothetical protein